MRISIALSFVAMVALVLAAVILRISNAHGHGLASGDRSAVGVLVATSVVCFAGAIGAYWNRRR